MCETQDEKPTDAALVKACNEGDAAERWQAFNTLFLRYRQKVLDIAHRYASDDSTAEDAMQDTFEYLLRRFPPQGRGLRLTAELATLLYIVAKHCAFTASRRARRCAGCGVDPDDLPAPEPPDDDAFEALLADLPPAQRETLRLRFGEDCPYCEIAERQGVPVGTVKSRINHAMRRLRQLAAAHQLPAA